MYSVEHKTNHLNVFVGGVGRVKHSTSRLDIRIISMYSRNIVEYLITVDGILCLMMAMMC